jgi:hypothetical protein
MNLHKLIWMTSKKELWFNPISLFEDEFEGRVATPLAGTDSLSVV